MKRQTADQLSGGANTASTTNSSVMSWKRCSSFRRDKNHAAGGNLPVLAAGLEPGVSPNHVIHFILVMRALQVEAARGQNVESSAHGLLTQELAVGLAAMNTLAVDLGEIDVDWDHAKMPPKIRSVNCGIRFCTCKSPSGLYH